MTAPRILVVEDDAIIAAYIASTLERAGFIPVGMVSRGEQALEFVSTCLPDLVLMDVGLSGPLDGIATGALLRERHDLPVVYLTAHSDPGTIARAKATQPVGFLTKPFQMTSLQTTLEVALQMHSVNQRLRAAERDARDAEAREAALAARYETLLRMSSDGIHVLDEDGRVVEVSDAFCRMLGYTREELRNLPMEEWDVRWPAAELRAKMQELLTAPAVFETRHRRKDGCVLDVEVNAGGVLLHGRRLLYASARDITTRKAEEKHRLALERQLRDAQKSESLQVMAGGVAHNFNNLLMVVLSSLELMDAPPGTPMAELIDDAREAAQGAAQISGSLLTYVGKSQPVRLPRSLRSDVRDLLPLLRPAVPGNVQLKVEDGADDPWVAMEQSEVRQLLVNLVTNALEALAPDGGAVHVSVRALERRDPASGTSLPWACLQIRDNGIGMDAATQQRIFDPFFSTKFAGRGLGLPVSLGIVRACGGDIEITSAPQQGTRVRVFLPVTAPAGAVDAAALPVELPHAEPRLGPCGPNTILLVDDEVAVLRASRRLLERGGHRVLTARSGAEALQTLQAHHGELACVVLDLSMPEMDGWLVLGALRAQYPALYVVVATGYDLAEVQREHHAIQPDAWLQKPYSLADLGEALQHGRAAKAHGSS